eukprot:1760629-Prymnesium_polylepis.1
MSTKGGMDTIHYVDYMTQVDGSLLETLGGTQRFTAGTLFARVFSFTPHQMRAELVANEIRVPVRRMKKLLRACAHAPQSSGSASQAVPFPYRPLCVLLGQDEGCWVWKAVNFSAMLCDPDMRVKLLHIVPPVSETDHMVWLQR